MVIRMKKIDKKKFRFHIKLSYIIVVLMIVLPIILIGRFSESQIYCNSASRWSKDGDYGHVSVFFENSSGLTDKNIKQLRAIFDRELKKEKVKSSSENCRVFVDCYYGIENKTVSKNSGSAEVIAYGVGGDFFTFHQYELLSGCYLNDENIMKDLVVIDEELAFRLFGAVDISGMKLEIDNCEYVVSGVIREEDTMFSKEAAEDKPVIYMSYEAFGTDGTIKGYEVMMPEKNKDFIEKHIDKAFEEMQIDRNNYKMVNVSNRFEYGNLYELMKDFFSRSMVKENVINTHWENAARAVEDLCVVLLFIETAGFVSAFAIFIKLIYKLIKSRKESKIDTVILDVGKVLVDFTPEEFLEKKGISKEKIPLVADAVMYNDIWEEFDRGIMTEEETLSQFIEASKKLEKEIRIAFGNLNGILKKYDYTELWISELKKRGYRILFLSNLSEKLYRECSEELSFVSRMDGGVFSFQVKMKKPEADIYTYIIEKYKLTPEKCVFIDDREKNLWEAENAGMKTILFTSVKDVSKRIKKLTRRGE